MHIPESQAVLRIRIRSDPDLFGRIRIRILALINDPISTCLVCKSHKYSRITCCLSFWFMNILFKAYFGQKNLSEEVCQKIYIGKDPDPDPDPDVFKSRIRIRSKIVWIRNTDHRLIPGLIHNSFNFGEFVRCGSAFVRGGRSDKEFR
jgi:hypothetical protein